MGVPGPQPLSLLKHPPRGCGTAYPPDKNSEGYAHCHQRCMGRPLPIFQEMGSTNNPQHHHQEEDREV